MEIYSVIKRNCISQSSIREAELLGYWQAHMFVCTVICLQGFDITQLLDLVKQSPRLLFLHLILELEVHQVGCWKRKIGGRNADKLEPMRTV